MRAVPQKMLKVVALVGVVVWTPATFALQAEDVQDVQEVNPASQDPKPQDVSPVRSLIEEVQDLRAEIARIRHELATAWMERDEARRQLAELQQFMRDRREFGDDFERYQSFREMRSEEERQKLAAETRARRDREIEERRQRRDQLRAEQQARAAEEAVVERYRRAGFDPVGLDVYIGRTGFFYDVKRSTGTRVEYEPIIGHFLTPVETSAIDYSAMTISGTILNASGEVRNIGIAIAFFDQRGNQVGSETIQLNNARPDVPYPFTSRIEMALDGPFRSSSSWVLYADPVEGQPSPPGG
ncbi:MAG: hypothetical protein ACR2GY_00210 [Phycisphaerales bacterium]